MAERPKVSIDRVLPNEQMRPQHTIRVRGGTRAMAPIGKTWMNGSTLRVRFMGGAPEDLYCFNAARDGLYRIDTRGPTDVVMKFFGPNSHTALIAEDDDSGIDTNALINADLIAGQYFVQLRHYNRASGKGNYSIKVQHI